MTKPSSSIAGTRPAGLILRNGGCFKAASPIASGTCSNANPSSFAIHSTRAVRDFAVP